MNPVSFDLVAPHYRWLETIAFGNALQRAQTCWIDTIARPKRTLIFGEGDGRFLCELVRAYPKIDVESGGSPAKADWRIEYRGPGRGLAWTGTDYWAEDAEKCIRCIIQQSRKATDRVRKMSGNS